MGNEVFDQDSVANSFRALKANAIHQNVTSVKQRKALLQKLLTEILAKQTEIEQAIFLDFKRSPLETKMSEIWLIVKEIKFAIRYLNNWMTIKNVPTPAVFFGNSSHIQFQAKGVVLIISPWNFPFNLSFSPLISAIAAGNTVLLKPSEMATHSAQLIKEIVENVFEKNVVNVLLGGRELATQLINTPFNHIFFTGSTAVGKIIMGAAAKNLASVTLELGGKSPVIIDEKVNIKSAAENIIFSKFYNNGQICIAPDFVLVHKSIEKEFVEALKQALQKMYPPEKLSDNTNYGRLVNEKATAAMQRFVDDAIEKGAKAENKIQIDIAQKFVAPLLISNVTDEMLIANEEIFGPILPIETYTTIEGAVARIHKNGKPLGTYYYGANKTSKRYVTENVQSGALVFNQAHIHHLNSNLPFGGSNQSGIGKSHGYFGFLEFSNQKAIVKTWWPLEMAKIFYPPHSKLSKKLAKIIVKYF